MVARDVIRKKTLSAHPKLKDGKWSDPHVGSTVNISKAPPAEGSGTASGSASSDVEDAPKKKGA